VLPKNVLVTGHDGYVGAVLVPFLAERGYVVTGLDDFYFEDCAFSEPFRPAHILRKDIRDLEADDLRGFDAIIHLAALSNDPLGELDPQLTLDINAGASARLAQIAKNAGVRRFLYASSCSVYGSTQGEWMDENSPTHPLTAYSHSKVRAEESIRALAGGGFFPVSLRFSTVYGVSAKLRVDLVVNNLSAWGVTAKEIRILSDGTPWRPLIHVEDVARAYEFFLRTPEEAVQGRTFNVGFNEQNVQVRTIADAVAKVMPGIAVRLANRAEKDTRTYRVRFDQFTALSGLLPKWDLESGIRQLVDAYRQSFFTADDFAGSKYVRVSHLKGLMDQNRLDPTLRWKSA